MYSHTLYYIRTGVVEPDGDVGFIRVFQRDLGHVSRLYQQGCLGNVAVNVRSQRADLESRSLVGRDDQVGFTTLGLIFGFKSKLYV